MYVLSKEIVKDCWEPVGWFDEFPEAVCALEDELKKKDGQTMKIEKEDEQNDALRTGA